MPHRARWRWMALLAVTWSMACLGADTKKVVFVAGGPSHSPLEHEHRAGCLLLQKSLRAVPGLETLVVTNGWPADDKVFDGAAAVVIYSDGGGGHPAVRRDNLARVSKLMQRGIGLGCIHYAVEVPKDKGGPEFLQWIGGYFETFWSVNPHWDAQFKSLPDHPITRGVQPFTIRDEWYYNMRFPETMTGVTPILTAVPPDGTRGREGINSPHEGNPHAFARKGMPEHVMWALQRQDGGRGFGFTGGHFHMNWGNGHFRKVVLNAILWIARMDVPANGVESQVTKDDLLENLDPKPGSKPSAPPPPKAPPAKP